jgi:Beta-galactosidase trimerisation domain
MRRQKEVNLSVLGSRKQWLESVPERSNAKDPAPLKIKEVWVENRRYVVCLNEEERRKDGHGDRDHRSAAAVWPRVLSGADRAVPCRARDLRRSYNDILRPFFDALYRMDAEVDFVDPSTLDLSAYKLIVVPALYAASDAELARLDAFAKAGGRIVFGFSDENVKVRTGDQPGGIAEAAGVTYSQFTIPQNVSLEGDPYQVGPDANQVRWWMKLLTPKPGTTLLARYGHPVWGLYAAATRQAYGQGEVTYIGFMPSDAQVSAFLEEALKRTGLWGAHRPRASL